MREDDAASALREVSLGVVERAALQAYAEAAGDANPIHLDDEAARRAGLPAPVAQGMYLMGRVEAALRAQLSPLSILGFDVHFVRPVPCGTSLTLSARVAESNSASLTFRVVVRDATGALCLVGAVRVAR